MSLHSCFHAREGAEFLGLRLSRRGDVEVVYDGGWENGRVERRVWRVLADGAQMADVTYAQEQRLSEALRIAAAAPRVLPRLHAEMKKRAITLETVSA